MSLWSAGGKAVDRWSDFPSGSHPGPTRLWDPAGPWG